MKSNIPAILTLIFFSFSFNMQEKLSDLKSSTSGEFNFADNKLFMTSLSDTTEEPQTENPEYEPTAPLKDVSGMFNERGYYRSNSFNFDDQEIINDFNGNLLYSIPMYSYALGGDMNLQMKLTRIYKV